MGMEEYSLTMKNPLYETGEKPVDESPAASADENESHHQDDEIAPVGPSGNLLPPPSPVEGKLNKKAVCVAVILVAMSLLNFTDRFIVSSVLIDIETYFGITKSTAGLLQTVYFAGFTLCAPFVGYFGDRFNRKYLLIVSMILWLISIIGGSFVSKNQFVVFLLLRAVFGAATSFFTTIGVPIIGDALASCPQMRSRTLTLYNIGPPLGNGLAYLISLIANDLFPNDWRVSMRFTPFLVVAVLVLHVIVYEDPERLNIRPESGAEKRKYSTDLKTLFANKTYVLLLLCWTTGLTALIGFSFWAPTYIDYILSNSNISKASIDRFKKAYSITQSVAGIIGILAPSEITNYFKKKNRASLIDCYMLAFGFMATSVLLFTFLTFSYLNNYLAIFNFALLVVTFNLGWVVESQILLEVIEPKLRSSANGLILTTVHLIGDNLSPYWVGLIANACLNSRPPSSRNDYFDLKYCTEISLYPIVYFALISGTFALFTSITYAKDSKSTQKPVSIQSS